MKLVKFLSQEGTNLISDPTNQNILTLLVNSECSISELAVKLKLPNLKTWRRIQKLVSANLVELSRVETIGNIQKKFYRATATWFAPQQYLHLKPKDANLISAFEIYSNIQRDLLSKLLEIDEVPSGTDPVDFSLFANMQAFTQVWKQGARQAKIIEIEDRLSKYKKQISFKESEV